MRLLLLITIFFISCLFAKGQIIVNEFSQGSSGSKEYIELLVTGTKTCTDSTADLRGWIIDDQNGWYGGLGTGISSGHFRFSAVETWAKVPYGAIILLYNSSNKNESITMANDPLDADGDHVYVVPHQSQYIEVHNSQPFSPSSPSFSYPEGGYTLPDATDWPLRVGLNNTFDAIVITSPTVRNQAYFSITYGLVTTPPYQTPTVHLVAPVTSGQNCFLSDANFQAASSWRIGTVPQSETPGAPNTVANAAWIHSMRSTLPRIPITYISACVRQGQSYLFNGQTLTTTGSYETVYKSIKQCDSVVSLYLLISTTKNQTISGCGTVPFNGIAYTASTIIKDTLKSTITACDSLYFITNLQVLPTPVLTISGNTLLCNASETTLTATAAGAGIKWSTGATINSIIVSPDNTSIYTAIAALPNGCADTATVQVTVENFKLLLAASASTVVVGNPVLLQTFSTLPYRVISWSPAMFFTNQTAQQQTIKPLANTTIRVVAASGAGCLDTAVQHITVLINGLQIPTAFTPNGDGKNDAFRVLGNIKTIDLKIYNRWGNVVFQTTNSLESWDGFYKGRLQPPGVFVYIIEAVLPDGKRTTRKGTVTMLY